MSVLALTDLVAVITGAGSGIGLATADAMLREGARVAALDLQPPPARPNLLPLACDVTEQPSVDAAIGAAAAHFGGIDVLVNNAGIGAQGTVEDNDLDEWRRGFPRKRPAHLPVDRAPPPPLRPPPPPASAQPPAPV